jgi:hypothetical protein
MKVNLKRRTAVIIENNYPTTHQWRRRVERRYSSYCFTTSTLDGVSCQRHAPAALYPGERTTVPTGQEAGWAP